jgi:hypothetical protein
MSTITVTPQPVEAPEIEASAVFPWPLHWMSVEQYDALVESGISTWSTARSKSTQARGPAVMHRASTIGQVRRSPS